MFYYQEIEFQAILSEILIKVSTDFQILLSEKWISVFYCLKMVFPILLSETGF